VRSSTVPCRYDIKRKSPRECRTGACGFGQSRTRLLGHSVHQMLCAGCLPGRCVDGVFVLNDLAPLTTSIAVGDGGIYEDREGSPCGPRQLPCGP